jgi:hypothetical protein
VWCTLKSVTGRKSAVLNPIGCWRRQVRGHARPTLLHFDEAGVRDDLSSHLSALAAR